MYVFIYITVSFILLYCTGVPGIISQSKVVTVIDQYIYFTCLICFANAYRIFALNWQDLVMALVLVTNPAGECWCGVIYYLCIIKVNTTFSQSVSIHISYLVCISVS